MKSLVKQPSNRTCVAKEAVSFSFGFFYFYFYAGDIVV